MSTGKVILVILVGVAIGMVSGILLAPRKGTEIQQKIIIENDGIMSNIMI